MSDIYKHSYIQPECSGGYNK